MFFGKIYSWGFIKKLSCNFLSFIPFSMYFRSLLDFLEFLIWKNQNGGIVRPAFGLRPSTVGSAQRRNEHGASPCPRRGARACLHGGHRTWFTSSGVATGRDRADEAWRHRRLQHADHYRRVPDRVSGAGAHWCGRSMMRWAEAARRRCPSMVAALRW
jgi:hypothetical protein